MFPRLTGQEPPFEEALNWLQFAYTVDRAGAYVVPASTALTQSAVVEGEKLFTSILYNLRRLYPEVYGPAVSLGWAPERREFSLEEGKGLSDGTSVTILSKLGAYTGRFNNLSPCIARMNNHIPSLTNVYLNTTLMGPMPDTLEYVPLTGRLGQPHGYTSTRTGGVTHTGAPKRPPPHLDII